MGFAEEDETRALRGANSEFGRALCDGTLELEVEPRGGRVLGNSGQMDSG